MYFVPVKPAIQLCIVACALAMRFFVQVANAGDGSENNLSTDKDKLKLDWQEYQTCIRILAKKAGVTLDYDSEMPAGNRYMHWKVYGYVRMCLLTGRVVLDVANVNSSTYAYVCVVHDFSMRLLCFCLLVFVCL